MSGGGFGRPIWTPEPKILYLQEKKVTDKPSAIGPAFRTITTLSPEDFELDAGLYSSNADIVAFFVTTGERVTIVACGRCGSPVDESKIRSATGLTPVHTCA